jgi:hypothetical protein
MSEKKNHTAEILRILYVNGSNEHTTRSVEEKKKGKIWKEVTAKETWAMAASRLPLLRSPELWYDMTSAMAAMLSQFMSVTNERCR